jgi:hypothetical protein
MFLEPVLPKPMFDITQTAHVLRLYTKARGKYVATAQQPRSHELAQDLSLLREGLGGGEEEGVE